MSDLRTAAQQALEALKGYRREMACGQPCDAERVLEATLAQEQPSPINQCGETCERAKLCAICARGIEQEQPDTDCHAQGVCQRSGYSIGAQQEQEWLTGCPECGMNSGCDCDSGTWRMEEQEVAERDAEIASLREANERFGQRQEWWTEQMFALEQERDALKAEVKALREANDNARSKE